MKFSFAKAKLPSLANSLLAVLSAVLLIFAFPDFEFWFLAFIALAPLFYAIAREKESLVKSFVLGWIFGEVFFFGTCWWLAFSGIQYASIPSVIAYGLVFAAAFVVALFPAIFCLALAQLLRRFGDWAMFLAPVLWTAIEFLRFYATGNNWNAIGYSQAFQINQIQMAQFGGIYLVGFLLVSFSASLVYLLMRKTIVALIPLIIVSACAFGNVIYFQDKILQTREAFTDDKNLTKVIAIQPNVPMRGLKYKDLMRLRQRHIELSEKVLQELKGEEQLPTAERQLQTVVIFPESPMNFQYSRDREFQEFLREFTQKNNVSVLFNAAEPADHNKGLYNSAVLVNERGARIAQYDKIHLLPFGEFVPLPSPLAEIVPPVVGNFEFGKSYDLMPLGDAKAGIMICFESHFPNLTREFAGAGADVLVELTNDGYLGNTPVLRQHLANAVFRAVETNRPVLRVTNVGITAYIDKNGKIYDATAPYTEDTRVWAVQKSDALPTFYVKYGDWFAWICSIASWGLLILSLKNLTQRRKDAKTQS